MPTGWGFYVQGSDELIEIEKCGEKLSLLIHCPIHYPAWGKPIFECKCGVLFPLFVVIASINNNPEFLINQHIEGYKPLDGSYLKNGIVTSAIPRFSMNKE
jgi:hypothetical protein